MEVRTRILGFVALLLSAFVQPAYAADCALNDGRLRPPGSIVYNSDFKVMQYCDGADWRTMLGGGIVDPGLADLTDVDDALGPADGNALVYDSASGTWMAGTAGLGVEDDPQVGAVTSAQWCRGDGAAVQCDQSAPSFTEVDPEVGTLNALKWCAANAGGTALDCTQNAPAGDNLGNHAPTQNISLGAHWLSGDGGNEGVYVAADGRVGIGTTTLGAPLTIINTPATAAGIDLRAIGNTNGTTSMIQFSNSDQAPVSRLWTDSSTSQAITRLKSLGPLVLHAGTVAINNANEFLYITTVGDVGIGTASPGMRLDVGVGRIGSSYDAGTYDNIADASLYLASANPAIGLFDTGAPSGLLMIPTGSGGFEMRIASPASGNVYTAIATDASGKVGIGMTPSYALDVNGTVRAAAYLYASDERLKTEIRSLDGLSLISRLRGVSFIWKSTGQPATGLIAQEVEAVLPAAVATDDSGMKAVDYQQLIGPLVEAVKSLKAENDALHARVEKLEAAEGQAR